MKNIFKNIFYVITVVCIFVSSSKIDSMIKADWSKLTERIINYSEMDSDFIINVLKNALQDGYDINQKEQNEYSILDAAIILKDYKLAEFIIDYASDNNIIIDNKVLTCACILAISCNQYEISGLLIKLLNVTDLDSARTEYGDPLIVKAVAIGNEKIVDLLTFKGINLDATSNNSGMTALLKAVKLNNFKLVEKLDKLGADWQIEDHMGNTAKSVAISNTSINVDILNYAIAKFKIDPIATKKSENNSESNNKVYKIPTVFAKGPVRLKDLSSNNSDLPSLHDLNNISSSHGLDSANLTQDLQDLSEETIIKDTDIAFLNRLNENQKSSNRTEHDITISEFLNNNFEPKLWLCDKAKNNIENNNACEDNFELVNKTGNDIYILLMNNGHYFPLKKIPAGGRIAPYSCVCADINTSEPTLLYVWLNDVRSDFSIHRNKIEPEPEIKYFFKSIRKNKDNKSYDLLLNFTGNKIEPQQGRGVMYMKSLIYNPENRMSYNNKLLANNCTTQECEKALESELTDSN